MKKTTFINDQRISRLSIESLDSNDVLQALKGKQDDSRRWIPIDRAKFENRFSNAHRSLFAVTSYAGVGKSIFLEQLEFLLPNVSSELMTLRVQFADLPNDWQHYLHGNVPGQDDPFLVKRFIDDFSGFRRAAYAVSEIDKRELGQWIEAMIRIGSFVLIIDGLDEYHGSDTRTKAGELRRLLTEVFPKLHCIVGGRLHSITDTLWHPLFSESTDLIHQPSRQLPAAVWEFLRVESFDSQQAERFLGKPLLERFNALHAEFDVTPRSLEQIRICGPSVIASLHSSADLYWNSISRSLPKDNREGFKEHLVHTKLKYAEILHILSAIGITMALWNDDPHFAPASSSSFDEFGTNIPLNSFCHRPVLDENPGVMEVGTNSSTVVEFEKRLFQRLYRIYPDWRDLDPTTKRRVVEHWYQELIKLNSQYVEFEFFQETQGEKLRWKNATMRDFFAALWMTTKADDLERNAILIRLTCARDHRDSSIAEIWRFICGMPMQVGFLSVDQNANEQNLCWLRMVKPLCLSADKPHNFSGRPTEWMYRAWPGLLQRAGFLTNPAWSDEDLLVATDIAQRFMHPTHRSSLAQIPPTQDDLAWTLVGEFLTESFAVYRNNKDAARIIDEDLELRWGYFKSDAGMMVQVGVSGNKVNPERLETLPYAYTISSFQITNRLYAIFDDRHASHFDDYAQYSPKEQCPAIYISWYDAMMFSIWCHGYLPSEWEWEYASRAECRNPNSTNARFYQLDFKEKMDDYAWYKNNSNGQTHPVGQKNPNFFKLYDTLGNVSEWCRTRCTQTLVQVLSERRRLRGGNFAYPKASDCSSQEEYRPHFHSCFTGFRPIRIVRVGESPIRFKF
jgi:hypothetical protein